MRWRLAIVVVAMLAPLMTSSQSTSSCPANTFECDDGSCIPMDWRGDGEKDCEDGSDEKSTTSSTNSTSASASDVISADEDIFDQIVTVSTESTTSSEAETTTSTSDDVGCTSSSQQRVDNCSEPVVRFLHEVDKFDVRSRTFLSDPALQAKISSGCELMNTYQECVQREDEMCSPDEGVRSWREVEMFLCQLVLPAIKEHPKCFESIAKSSCPKPKSDRSTLCQLVSSVQSDVACIETTTSGDCSAEAAEMLAPIREEAVNTGDAIRCPAVADTPATESGEPRIVDSTAENSDETTTTTESAEEENKQPLTINMADAVNAMYYIYDICSANYSADPFAAVAVKLCAKQDEVAKFSDCYQKTLEKQKCAIRNATTSCDALTSFNNNLDCAIATMNDVCDVDAQNLVVDIQEDVNDLLISQKCFDQKPKDEKQEPEKAGEFRLHSTLPKCTDDQENSALACLVELVEINKQLSQFANLNFLLEIASPNSTVVDGICQLFGRYESCLDASVFHNSSRCAFASPLNSLARIGLSPICSFDSRPLLARHRECLQNLAVEANAETNCQSGLSSLSQTVSMMLQGVHGEALLCKSFYTIRDTFACGEKAVQQKCGINALNDLLLLKTKMTSLGEEEGCPREPPANLDEIIARPVARPTPAPRPSKIDTAPMARPLHPPPPQVPAVPSTPSTTLKTCAGDEQKKFEECVRPLTAFQPHPLSVIAVPRDIDKACQAFAEFKNCSARSECHPLWAKGMTAMFEFACFEKNAEFKQVRKCIREQSSQDVVRNCVSDFSRGAPTQACLSSHKLLACATPNIQKECGADASQWVTSYVTRFANAIDVRCKVGDQLPVGRVVGVGCSSEEEAIIEHCAAPLNDIGARLEELFAGGMQALIKNVNALAPVFAGGCNLTDEFRSCAQFLLQGRTSCSVSSCMIEAGKDICNTPDPAKTIDDNLSCLFGQMQEPKFAQCVRTTLSTVKQLSLSSLRNVLPKFVDCTHDIVLAKCGSSPIQVLRAMSSPDLCIIGANNTRTVPAIVPKTSLVTEQPPVRVEPKIAGCSSEELSSFESCSSMFFSQFTSPVDVLRAQNVTQLCDSAIAAAACVAAAPACASRTQNAVATAAAAVCRTDGDKLREASTCISRIVESENVQKCVLELGSDKPCDEVNKTVDCIVPEVLMTCGDVAASIVGRIFDSYVKLVDAACVISMTTSTPAATTTAKVGCGDADLEQFLQCETHLDKFGFGPIGFISDPSRWDDFCSTFNTSYRPCVDALSCRVEPTATAHTNLIDSICNRVITLRDQKKFAACLSGIATSPDGRRCASNVAHVDTLSPKAALEMCQAIDKTLQCSIGTVEKECGFDAVLHVFDLHSQWASSFDPSCILSSPQSQPPPSNTNSVEPSRDIQPVSVQKDETTPPSTTSTAETTTAEPTTSTAETTTELSNRIDDNVDSDPTTVPTRSTAHWSPLVVFVFVLSYLLF